MFKMLKRELKSCLLMLLHLQNIAIRFWKRAIDYFVKF